MHDDPSLVALVDGNVFISVWRGPVDSGHLGALRGAYAEAVGRNAPGGLGIVTLVTRSALGARLEGELRREAAATHASLREHTLAMGLAVEGEGFQAAAARSIITGVQLVARGPRARVFDALGPCCDWVVAELAARGALRPGGLSDEAFARRLEHHARQAGTQPLSPA
ncbi:MAG TPA: hypothetical protein VFS43_47700 [Polyangiaceae bacterium]|nr:hypothetical protein [Polyangiaceae bacterium]